jgi:uncharacterized protein (TIGR00369 family)
MRAPEKSTYSTAVAGGYPPQKHMLRDLMVSMEFQGKGRSTVRAPVVPEVCTDQGAMRVGILATLGDMVGGGLSIRAVYPDWIATADLSIHTTGRATSGVVAAAGSVIRAGRTTVVVEVTVHQETDASAQKTATIGSVMMTFSRLPRREDNREVEIDEDSRQTVDLAAPGSGLTRPYLDELGIRVLDEAAGVVELDMTDYVRNSVGVLQGGTVAILADVAGQHAARRATGKRLTTSDLAIHYLLQGRVGPFRTRTKVLRTTSDTALTRVDVIDSGADGRPITVVMNTATMDPTSPHPPAGPPIPLPDQE